MNSLIPNRLPVALAVVNEVPIFIERTLYRRSYAFQIWNFINYLTTRSRFKQFFLCMHVLYFESKNMNNFILCTIFIISLFVTKLAVAQPSPGQDTSWEIKYFLFIDTQNNFRSNAALAKKENSSSQRCVYQKDCLNIDELLLPTTIFKVKKKCRR